MRFLSLPSVALVAGVLLLSSPNFARGNGNDESEGDGEVEMELEEAAPSPLFVLPPYPNHQDLIFIEAFPKPSNDLTSLQWIKSSDPEYSEGDFTVSSNKVNPSLNGDYGLLLKNPARHHALSKLFNKPYSFQSNSKPFIVQYEVRFNDPLQCGGAYMKLLTGETFQQNSFNGKSPYSIMFGPDKCGDNDRVHFIFRYTNPLNGEVEEKHLKNPPKILNDRKTHLYSLALDPSDDSFTLSIDGKVERSGSLLNEFNPPVEPSKQIDDPNDKKPLDWVDEEMIIDPNDHKPEGYDSIPSTIPDPDQTKPEDWDEELDGEWEAPSIPNPEYKGPWTARKIPNPEYKGKWAPRKIDNPNYFTPKDVVKSLLPIYALGFELWTMQENIEFDNILVSNNQEVASSWSSSTFQVKKEFEAANVKSDDPTKPNDSNQNSNSFVNGFGLFNDYPFIKNNFVAIAVTALVGFISSIILSLICCCGSSNTQIPEEAQEGEGQQEDGEEPEGEGERESTGKDNQPDPTAEAESEEEATQSVSAAEGTEAAGPSETTNENVAKSNTKQRKPRKADS